MAGKGSAPGERRGGRKKGVPNKVNAATRERIERECDPIGFLMDIVNGNEIEAAPNKDTGEVELLRPTVDQRINAAQTLARKLVPDAKDKPIKIDLPEIGCARDAANAMGVVAVAVASGEITPSDGQAFSSIIEIYRKTFETAELEERISELEGR